VLGKQGLYCLSRTSGPFCSGCFGDGSLKNYLPKLAWNQLRLYLLIGKFNPFTFSVMTDVSNLLHHVILFVVLPSFPLSLSFIGLSYSFTIKVRL
jgi:hypothetical protein